MEAPALIERDALEAQLERLRTETEDSTAGLFGPESMLWEVNREALIFVGSGRAALLQLAHPYVAEAIDRFSGMRENPFGRFHRTFRNVFAMVWGDLDAAFAAARGVHRVHTKIEGTLSETLGPWPQGHHYRANEPAALLWVHATLWETSLLVYQTFVRELSAEERDRYYSETRRFAALFGLDESMVPATWSDFEGYNREMWHTLVPGRAAREIGAFLFEPHGFATGPAFRWLELVTAEMMPEPLRAGFGFPQDERSLRRRARVMRLSTSLLRGSHRYWPKRVRFVPPYLEAQRRVRGDAGRDRVGEWLTRLWLGPEARPKGDSRHPY